MMPPHAQRVGWSEIWWDWGSLIGAASVTVPRLDASTHFISPREVELAATLDGIIRTDPKLHNPIGSAQIATLLHERRTRRRGHLMSDKRAAEHESP